MIGAIDPMRRHYKVCEHCRSSWIWEDRLIHKPDMKCNQCGEPWQVALLPDLRRKVSWAKWNFNGIGARWPKKSYKDALLEPPPGLQGGQKAKRAKKGKDGGLQKALKEHWDKLPEAFRNQCTALGWQVTEPPVSQDLPTPIKEHLQSLPTDLKEAVEKIVEPDKPEPTLATKVKQAVGTLKQLSEKKSALQNKVDAVKAQYTQLLQDLKDLQGKIEVAQKELQTTTTQYNQQLEKEKQQDADEMAEELSPEALITAMANVGLQATASQVKDLAAKLVESAAKRRKCTIPKREALKQGHKQPFLLTLTWGIAEAMNLVV